MVLCSFSIAIKLIYKFCLLSENSNVEDYVTEYFIQELVSGTMFVLSLCIWRNICCTSEIIIYTVFRNILCSSTVQIQEWICGVCPKLKKGNNWSRELWLQKNTSLEDPSKVLICVKLPVFVLTIFKCVLSSTLNLWMRLLEQHS